MKIRCPICLGYGYEKLDPYLQCRRCKGKMHLKITVIDWLFLALTRKLRKVADKYDNK